MIELLNNQLTFRFRRSTESRRVASTSSAPCGSLDDNRNIPPQAWVVSVEHVDDFADKLPDTWRTHGGVFMPMYQSEALWINFSCDYPAPSRLPPARSMQFQ